MKVKTKLCKLSAMIMEEIAKVPEDLDEEDLPVPCYELLYSAQLDFEELQYYISCILEIYAGDI